MAAIAMSDLDQPLKSLERRLAADGTAYHEAGEGEPVVLIHGVGMRLEAWVPQIEVLSKTHRVIAVDMPGHGESAQLPARSDLTVFVDWLGKFLDAMGLHRANVAGHSMGALVSGGVAATFPSRVRRVALLNGVFRRDEAARQSVQARAASIETAGIDIDGPVQRWFDDDEASRLPRRLTRSWLMAMNRDAYATAYSAFAGGDATYADAWPRVTCPALFLTGSGDPIPRLKWRSKWRPSHLVVSHTSSRSPPYGEPHGARGSQSPDARLAGHEGDG